MEPDEYMEISTRFGEIMTSLEGIDAALIDKLGARCHSAV
jgi:hypothetical protein